MKNPVENPERLKLFFELYDAAEKLFTNEGFTEAIKIYEKEYGTFVNVGIEGYQGDIGCNVNQKEELKMEDISQKKINALEKRADRLHKATEGLGLSVNALKAFAWITEHAEWQTVIGVCEALDNARAIHERTKEEETYEHI